MVIKLRLTASQYKKIRDSIIYPIIGFCGTGDYNDGTQQYSMYSLMDGSLQTLNSLDKPTEKFPVIFYRSDSELPLIENRLKQLSRFCHFEIIGLSVMIDEASIVTAIAHFKNGMTKAIDTWSIVGSDIQISNSTTYNEDETQIRTVQAFGEGTTRKLSAMCVGVVGASGTGNPMIEMLYRTGVGELVIIDPDIVEEKNLNRLLNASKTDAQNHKYKVDVMKRAIRNNGFSTKVEALPINLFTSIAVKALSRCDIVFGCTDTADSRALLNSLSRYYCIPYIDVGVRLDADGQGNVKNLCFAINYIAPDGRTLEDRESISSEEIYASTLLRNSPNLYRQQVREKYIKGINVDNPAVLCVNMAASSFAFLEFLSRIHNLRSASSSLYERIYLDYTNMRIVNDDEKPVTQNSLKNLGCGDVKPLLGRTEL